MCLTGAYESEILSLCSTKIRVSLGEREDQSPLEKYLLPLNTEVVRVCMHNFYLFAPR